MSKQDRSIIFSELQLAEHWGVTTRRIRQLAESGIAIRTGSGYDAIASDAKFIAHMRAADAPRETRRKSEELRAALMEQKLARADKTMLRPDELRAAVLQVWSTLVGGIAEWRGTLWIELDWICRDDPEKRRAVLTNLIEMSVGCMRKAQDQMLEVCGRIEGELRREVDAELRSRWLTGDRSWPGREPVSEDDEGDDGGDEDAD
jgi:hypothetical protein